MRELSTTVVRGDGRGRELGFATANLDLNSEQLSGLTAGVYLARIRWPGSAGEKAAIVNVGRRPTFGSGRLTAEAHVLDFEGNLYGKSVQLRLLEHLRDEIKFESREALIDQIEIDIKRARHY
ncbi:MAG: riboflavin kinase [Candidatus Latescibacterota bacterium]|nr:riboflavin kinase [Candidatus Latescibacterota bacterium]